MVVALGPSRSRQRIAPADGDIQCSGQKMARFTLPDDVCGAGPQRRFGVGCLSTEGVQSRCRMVHKTRYQLIAGKFRGQALTAAGDEADFSSPKVRTEIAMEPEMPG